MAVEFDAMQAEEEAKPVSELQWLETLWKLSRKERRFYHRLIQVKISFYDKYRELEAKRMVLDAQIGNFIQSMVKKYGITESKQDSQESDKQA